MPASQIPPAQTASKAGPVSAGGTTGSLTVRFDVQPSALGDGTSTASTRPPARRRRFFPPSRVHEHWLRTRDAEAAVAHAVEITARVITCAALITVSVLAASVVSDTVVVKTPGLGLTVGVLVDATVVRLCPWRPR